VGWSFCYTEGSSEDGVWIDGNMIVEAHSFSSHLRCCGCVRPLVATAEDWLPKRWQQRGDVWRRWRGGEDPNNRLHSFSNYLDANMVTNGLGR